MPSVSRKRPVPAKRSGTARKTVTTSVYGSESDEEITVDVLDFDGVEPAYVSAKVGATKSLGANSFESLRVDVSIMVPCVPDPDVIDRTFQSILDQAVELLGETVDDLLEPEE